MMMKLVHALIAVFTVLFFLVRRKLVYARVAPIKAHPICPGCGDASYHEMSLRSSSANCYLCTSACLNKQYLAQPKYKRDPEIIIDNEGIGQHPHDK